MTKQEEIISDEEIERVHANSNFGGMNKRDINLDVYESLTDCLYAAAQEVLEL